LFGIGTPVLTHSQEVAISFTRVHAVPIVPDLDDFPVQIIIVSVA